LISGAPCLHFYPQALIWFIGNTEVRSPTREQLLAADHTYMAAIKPPPAKADQLNDRYGNFLVYLKWRPSPDNAAALLVALELASPVSGTDRRTTPLFQSAPGIAFSHSQFDNILRLSLEHLASLDTPLLPLEAVQRYSWHSWRRGLASQLLKNQVPIPVIQALCRWATPEALKAYALLDAGQYSDLVEKAIATTCTMVQTCNLPPLDNDDAYMDAAAIADEVRNIQDEPHGGD